MRRISIHPLARIEMLEAAEYLEMRSEGLAKRLMDTISDSMQIVRTNPQIGTAYHHDTQRFNLKTFSYYLIYRIDSDFQLRMVALAHHRRHPDYWVQGN